jgi:ribokinase
MTSGMTTAARRVAVIGHAPHVVIGPVAALPLPGEIVHLDEHVWIPGGGGGIAFFQLVRSPSEVHFFTAVGDDSAGSLVLRRLVSAGAFVHAARPPVPHSHDVALVTPDGERTIIVIGAPLQPSASDPLPWDTLASCDAVFFTARDPELLRTARAARLLVVTARRAEALAGSGVEADVVVGSGSDPREASRRDDYPVPPRMLVMTAGAEGGWIETAAGTERFPPSPAPAPVLGSYGAGDTFAAALTWYLAAGAAPREACVRAARHGAAVLRGRNPLDHQLALPQPPP